MGEYFDEKTCDSVSKTFKITRRYVMRFLSLCISLILISCSSHPRTKWTDPNMRIMVDGDGLAARDYVRIVHALQESGKWFVVDRRDAFQAIIKEQNRLHRSDPDRFKDEEKYAIWGRLYGVGAVVIGNVQCKFRNGFFHNYSHCLQHLAIVSAISGQVISTAEGTNEEAEMSWDGDIKIASNWQNTVDKLNDAFPKEYHQEKYNDDMHLFRAEAKEEGIRQKEEAAQIINSRSW